MSRRCEELGSWAAESEFCFEDAIEPYFIRVDSAHQLDSYFSWIPFDMESQLESQAAKLETWVRDLEDILVQTSVKLSQIMLAGLYLYYSGDHANAESSFDRASCYIDGLTADSAEDPDHLEAYQYLLNATRIHFLLRIGRDVEADVLFKLTRGMNLYPIPARATLLAMKALFLSHFGQSGEKLLLWQRVTELDPNSQDWHHFLYRAIRGIRRDRDYLEIPSDEEVEVCQTAYNLDQKSAEALFDMTMLYYETLKSNKARGEKNTLLQDFGQAGILRQLLSFSAHAVELNPQSIRANIRQAEILASLKDMNFGNLDRSEERFLTCLKLWPKSSEVLHKVGRFYAVTKRDRPQGMEYMKQAMEVGADNFPCLMDYLKAHVMENSPKSVLLQIVNEMMIHYLCRNTQLSKLYQIKACILWMMYRREEAASFWVLAVDTYPTCVDPSNLWSVMSCQSLFYSFRSETTYNSIRLAVREHLAADTVRLMSFKIQLLAVMDQSYISWWDGWSTRRRASQARSPPKFQQRNGGQDRGWGAFGGPRAVSWIQKQNQSNRSPGQSTWSLSSGSTHFCFDPEMLELSRTSETLTSFNTITSSSSSSISATTSGPSSSSTSATTSGPSSPSSPESTLTAVSSFPISCNCKDNPKSSSDSDTETSSSACTSSSSSGSSDFEYTSSSSSEHAGPQLPPRTALRTSSGLTADTDNNWRSSGGQL